MKSQRAEPTAPLSLATLHILLALSSADLHGYGILLEVSRCSQGSYQMGPGTLYDNLKKLLNLAWVEDYEQSGGDETRRIYRLTDAGRKALAADVDRMRHIVHIASRSLTEESAT